MLIELFTLLSLSYFGYRYYQIFYLGNNNITKHSDRNFIIDRHGKIAYKLRQNENNTKLLFCFHGITVNADYFDKVIENLPEGYDVVSYDIYGHGWSSSINKQLTLDRLSEQALFVLSHVCSHKKYDSVTLLGCSLGAMILNNMKLSYNILLNRTRFNDSDHFSSLIENSKNILIAPAGIKMNLPNVINLINIWGLGEVILVLFGRDIMRDFCVSTFNDVNNIELNSLLFLDSHPGFLRSIFSIIRNIQKCNYDYTNLSNVDVIVSRSDNLTMINTQNFSSDANIISQENLGHAEILTNSIDTIHELLN